MVSTVVSGLAAGGRTAAASVTAVRAWLFVTALFVLAMVIVGGATRLTDSGLSITEWRPLLGAIPPLTDAAWAEAFALYRQIPEYQIVNKGMSLEAFKFIYWWEWGHRFLGRVIGLVFFVPFVVFLVRRRLDGDLTRRLALLLFLGGLQGAVGWWMVSSGLSERVDVAPYRLAFHLTLACVILALLVYTAVSLTDRHGRVAMANPARGRDRSIERGAFVVVGLVLAQIWLGGLVAGNDAGLVYNTWPLMAGGFVPPEWLALDPLWKNFFENHATVQFVHRLGAYVLVAAVLWHAWRVAWRAPGTAGARLAGLLAALVSAQAVIGIATLLLVVPLTLALLHQGLAAVLLMVAAAHAAAARRTSAVHQG